MSASFTPGPWFLSDRDIPPIVYARSGADGRESEPMVALVDGGAAYANLPVLEAEANARLITAAPDLLEALTDAASDIDCLLDFVGESSAINMIGGRSAYLSGRKTLDKICAAIAKATGEST